MFTQPLLSCCGSAVQAAARGRAVPGCGAHMNIQWLPNVLRRVEYPTTDYILKYCTKWSIGRKKFTFAISSPDEFLLL